MKFAQVALSACLISVLGIGAAVADDCSGRDHTTGTVLGAVGGAAIGGVATNHVGGAVAGAVVGGLAGNAIARAQDCDRGPDRRSSRGGASVYVQQGFAGPEQDQYWSVDSYEDFNSDYRRIYAQIRRGREEGSLTRYDAQRYSRQLERIRVRADYQQRSGRFSSSDIEAQLRDLRQTIRFARREGTDDYRTPVRSDYGRR